MQAKEIEIATTENHDDGSRTLWGRFLPYEGYTFTAELPARLEPDEPEEEGMLYDTCFSTITIYEDGVEAISLPGDSFKSYAPFDTYEPMLEMVAALYPRPKRLQGEK